MCFVFEVRVQVLYPCQFEGWLSILYYSASIISKYGQLSAFIFSTEVYIYRWLLVEETIGSNCCECVHCEIEYATVSGMYQLSDVPEFVIDGFYDRPLLQQEGYDLVLHVASQTSNQLYALVESLSNSPCDMYPLSAKSFQKHSRSVC